MTISVADFIPMSRLHRIACKPGQTRSDSLSRTVQKTLPMLLFLIAFAAFFGCKQKQNHSELNTYRLSGETMGTTYSIALRTDTSLSEDQKEQISRIITRKLEWINQLYSTYRKDSVISRFNRHQKTDPFTVPEHFVQIIKLSQRIHKQTGGRFDPTLAPLIELWGFSGKARSVPPDAEEIKKTLEYTGMHRIEILSENRIRKMDPRTTLNLSAIAKGAGVDAVFEALKEEGFKNLMVEIGGEVRTGIPESSSGLQQDLLQWKIGIEKPDYSNKRALASVLSMTEGAVASSGDYRNFFEHKHIRYSHIIDPATGKPARTGTIMATVIGPDSTRTDAYATACLLLEGRDAIRLIESLPDHEFEARVVVQNKDRTIETLQTSGFPGDQTN